MIIGLDLSLTATGIALPSGSTHVVRSKEKGDARLVRIRDAVRAAARDADLAVIEDLPVHAYAAGTTGMVHGVVRTALMDMGVPYALIPPATLKAFATGRGNADKAEMMNAARAWSGVRFTDDNAADAAWLRWAGMDWCGAPAFALPDAQRDRLAKAKWPRI